MKTFSRLFVLTLVVLLANVSFGQSIENTSIEETPESYVEKMVIPLRLNYDQTAKWIEIEKEFNALVKSTDKQSRIDIATLKKDSDLQKILTKDQYALFTNKYFKI